MGQAPTGLALTALPLFHDIVRPAYALAALPALARSLSQRGRVRCRYHRARGGQSESKVSELGTENVAAFIMEPVQGSGGVIVPPEGYAKAMQDTCRALDILFIVDEVITGFGRTGPMFCL